MTRRSWELMAVAAIVLIAACVPAQTGSTSNTQSPQTTNNSMSNNTTE